MAERKIDVSRLGGDAVQLGGTSIEFIREDSRLLSDFNASIMEGIENNLEVIKSESQTYRPFLVLENEALHARVALYMSLSFDDSRIDVDNKIRGEHVFRTPFALASYIGSSTIKGTVDPIKNSVIDRDRFIFMNESEFIDMQSRAKDKSEFSIGLSGHARNIQNVDELLNKDLSSYNFEKMVRSGKFELWTFKKGQGLPIIYNPSAMYIKAFINASARFKNDKNNLSPESLAEFGAVTCDALRAYSEHERFVEDLYALESSQPELYKALQSVRYYINMNTPATYKAMEQNAKKFVLGKYEWRYMYGDAIDYRPLPRDERITIELGRFKVEPQISEKLPAQIIREFLKRESAIENHLADVACAAIDFLDGVNEEERIILTDFAYDTKFWTGFYKHCLDNNYIDAISEDFRQKYLHLQQNYREDKSVQKRKKKAQLVERRRQQAEIEQIKKGVEARTKELIRVLNDKYMELYARSYSQYRDGKLKPLTIGEIGEFKSLTDSVLAPSKSLELGKGLADKFYSEVKAMSKMTGFVDSTITMALTAEKRIEELKKTPNGELLLRLMDDAVGVDQRMAKQNKGLSQNARKPLTKKAVKAMILGMDYDTLMEYIDPNFEFGADSQEILMSIHDIYQARSTIRAYLTIKQKKVAVIESLRKLNDPGFIKEYLDASQAIGELTQKGVNLPIAISAQSYDAIKLELEQLGQKINSTKMQPKDYDDLLQFIDGKFAQMRKFIDFSHKLVLARDAFYAELGLYEDARSSKYKTIQELPEQITKAAIAGLKKVKVGPELFGFKETKNGWERYDDEGNYIGVIDKRAGEETIKIYKKSRAEATDPQNISDAEKDAEIFCLLHQKSFPSRELILSAVKRIVAESEGIEDAIKKYGQATDHLRKLVQELPKFEDLMKKEYSALLSASQDLFMDKCVWESAFSGFDWGRCAMIKGDNAPEHVQQFLVDAQARAEQRVLDKNDENLREFLSDMRKRMMQMIDSLDPRTKSGVDIDAYLSRSVVKSMSWKGGAVMPRSFIGQNGIKQAIEAVAAQKHKNCDMLTRFIMLKNRQSIKGGARNRSVGEDALLMEEMMLKPAEIYAMELCTTEQILANMDNEIVAEQKRMIKELKLDFLESIRTFALRGQKERDFVMNKDGLEKGYQHMFAGFPIEYTKLHPPLRRSVQREVEGVDYLNHCAFIMENLPLIRQHVESDTPFDGGKVDSQLLSGIEAIFSVQNASSDEEMMLLARSFLNEYDIQDIQDLLQ